ncbi:MAG: FAD-dependent monooxygenase, partial [Chlorobium phaeobacteroides]|nr:FAD-dependent monooxygenase [Chlorobium phaeobacteroides]
MRFDVAVVGGGPSGAVAAAELAKAGISTALIERNLENVKPCGGAIPLGLIEEFGIPEALVEKKLSRMSVRSPAGRMIFMEMPNGYVGMVRRERFDSYLRDRAKRHGSEVIEARMKEISRSGDTYTITLSKEHPPVEASYIIGADGANSRTVEVLGFSQNQLLVIAMQQRVHYSDSLKPYEALVEIWFDGDVSPDFYGWTFPKIYHIP